jgi:putative ABC transport system permease protein
MLRDVLFLARRSLAAAPGRAAVLALGLAVALFLPAFTRAAAAVVERALLERARSSPILVGARGSPFDLVMASLYFRGGAGTTIRYDERSRLAEYGVSVPLVVRHSAFGVPVVGTSPEYFEQRDLVPAAGRRPALLGEVLAGSAAARRLELEPGDTVRSDLANLYDLAGGYPTLLEVVGIAEPTGTPDDDVLFADVRTAWLLDGLLHGHQEVRPDEALNPEADEGENVEASAAVFLFQHITADNLDTFHLHGSAGDAPVTAVLVFPRDARRHDQLLGDFALEETLQAVRPIEVVRSVLGIVLRVSAALDAYFAAVAISTLAFAALVVLLSLRLRAPELELMRRIGASRGAAAAVVGAELAIVAAIAVAITGVAVWAGLVWVGGLVT